LADIQEAEREIDVYAVMVHVEALEDILQGARILHVLLINSASCFENLTYFVRELGFSSLNKANLKKKLNVLRK